MTHISGYTVCDQVTGETSPLSTGQVLGYSMRLLRLRLAMTRGLEILFSINYKDLDEFEVWLLRFGFSLSEEGLGIFVNSDKRYAIYDLRCKRFNIKLWNIKIGIRNNVVRDT